jgi:hypothetical protein
LFPRGVQNKEEVVGMEEKMWLPKPDVGSSGKAVVHSASSSSSASQETGTNRFTQPFLNVSSAEDTKSSTQWWFTKLGRESELELDLELDWNWMVAKAKALKKHQKQNHFLVC